MTTAGYSGRPLAAKLGLKPGMRVYLAHAPAGYLAALGAVVASLTLLDQPAYPLDCAQGFWQRRAELAAGFPTLKAALAPTGMLWVSWPKAAAQLATDLNEHVVREIGLAHGLVDVKVCAVDATWSGLKFVYRVKDRASLRGAGT
jgi:hypothetical protein